MPRKARGRHPRFAGPQVTTTVRLPANEWAWVKEKGLEYSSLLHLKVAELMRIEEERVAAGVAAKAATIDPRKEALRVWLADRNSSGLRTSPEEMALKRQELGL